LVCPRRQTPFNPTDAIRLFFIYHFKHFTPPNPLNKHITVLIKIVIIVIIIIIIIIIMET